MSITYPLPATATATEILDGAADYITEVGWAPDAWDTPEGPVGMWIAINLMMCGDVDGHPGLPTETAPASYQYRTTDVTGAISEHLGLRSGMDQGDWEDAPGRTQAEVVAALRGAARIAARPAKLDPVRRSALWAERMLTERNST